MARNAGSHPTTVCLIAQHPNAADTLADPGERHLLQRLQWADDQN